MFTMSFKQFVYDETAKTLGSDGSDPNPTATIKSAEKTFSNFTSNPQNADKIADVTRMSAGPTRRKAIFDMAAKAAKDRNVPIANQRANPVEVGEFMMDKFDKIGTNPGSGKLFMRKRMRKK